MSEKHDVRSLSNKLEGVLRRYLNCHYTEFGVKSNGNLDDGDWKFPVAFALGHLYGSSNNSEQAKKDIVYFWGNEFKGENIGDIVSRYEHYGFSTQDEAFDYVDKTIDKIQKLLGTEY